MNNDQNTTWMTAQEKSLRLAYGAKIKELRNALRMSQKELSLKAGIGEATLRKLERGQYVRRFKTVYRSCRNAIEAQSLATYMLINPPETK